MLVYLLFLTFVRLRVLYAMSRVFYGIRMALLLCGGSKR